MCLNSAQRWIATSWESVLFLNGRMWAASAPSWEPNIPPFKIPVRLGDAVTNQTAKGHRPLSSTVSWTAAPGLSDFMLLRQGHFAMEFISGCLRKYKGRFPTGAALALQPLYAMYSRNSLEVFLRATSFLVATQCSKYACWTVGGLIKHPHKARPWYFYCGHITCCRVMYGQ